MNITKDITIEDLVEEIPESVRYLSEKGIKCIACGEPIGEPWKMQPEKRDFRIRISTSL